MAQPSQGRSGASVPKKLANFTNSTAGLDLTLRLCHSMVLIGSGINLNSATVMRCSIAAPQIGLARRFLRFFCFLDCFLDVQDLLTAGYPLQSRPAVLKLAESSCLGMYLALEGTTIVSGRPQIFQQLSHTFNIQEQLHDMNVLSVSWYTPILLEAYKFWFYAICIAITRSVLDLLSGPETPSTRENSTDKKEKEKVKNCVSSTSSEAVSSTMSLLKRLMIDILDLTIPGSLLGWIPVSDTGVAFAMLASTILVWPAAWAKAQ